MVMHRGYWMIVGGLVAGCNLAASSEGTGGVSLVGAPGGACPRAMVVASSDYTSSNVSIVDADGQGLVLSSSLISSASAPPGLTTALSGDVVLPTVAPPSGALVLIDRFPNSVLTWLDPATAIVQRQMQVGTGFVSNPQDYLELTPTKAYVSRYETNANRGQQAYDDGGDVLVIDPTTVAITNRIDMAVPGDGEILPRPSGLLRIGDRVWVALQRTTAHFDRSGDARIVGIDAAVDAVAWSLDLPGAVGCGGWAISPSRAVVALACSSLLGEANAAEQSTIVLLDATTQPPVELKRISTAALGAPLGSALTFVDETLLLGVAVGDAVASRSDVAFTADTVTGTTTVLATSSAPFSFNDVRCFPGCTNQCVLTDASDRVLRVFDIASPALIPAAPVVVDTTIGLPPRSLGTL